jgi:hypothetical protein
LAFRVAQFTNKEGLHPSADATWPPHKQRLLKSH